MRNILLEIEYDGSAYSGWQIQKNALTIQGILEEKLAKILGEPIKLTAAGRTDAGVHALSQAANFKTRSNLNCIKLLSAVNTLLPRDIAVRKIKEAVPKFNARFSSKAKIYRYYIYNSKIKSAFWHKYSWQIDYKLDMAAMRKELKVITGTHNFKSFSAVEKRERQMYRKILKTSLKKKGSFIIVSLEGESFLYNMVRNIVGTIVEIGRGKLPAGSMQKILTALDRKKAGPCAPAKGLFLIKVKWNRNNL